MSVIHHPFPSIDQFSHIRRNVLHKAQYKGKDENGEPIMDRTAVMPILSYEGTCKLHGCVSKDTEVTLADGSTKPISEIIIGTSILSYDTERNKIEFDTVKNVIVQELEKDWLELTFENKHALKCTEDHPLFTLNRGWVEAKDLTENDEILEY